MSDRGQDLRLVEALLFASAQPLGAEVLASRLPEGSDVVGLVDELTEVYRNRGVNIVMDVDTNASRACWKLRTSSRVIARTLVVVGRLPYGCAPNRCAAKNWMRVPTCFPLELCSTRW